MADATVRPLEHPRRPDRRGRLQTWSGSPAERSDMGSNKHYPEERPVHRVTVDGFWMDRIAGDQRALRPIRGRDRHVTFAEMPPKPEDYPGALPEMLYAGSLVF